MLINRDIVSHEELKILFKNLHLQNFEVENKHI